MQVQSRKKTSTKSIISFETIEVSIICNMVYLNDKMAFCFQYSPKYIQLQLIDYKVFYFNVVNNHSLQYRIPNEIFHSIQKDNYTVKNTMRQTCLIFSNDLKIKTKH